LSDLARQEGNNDLLLECSWRLSDWATDKEGTQQAIENMIPVPTPRKRVFEALQYLIRSQAGEQLNAADFQTLCDEGIQFSLRKWHHLPDIVSDSHIPLLHTFQQFVELQEAAKQIFSSIATTNITNLDQRSTDLKAVLQTWRDRLPNLWDDVNIWSDMVAWRQHIFQAINRAYLPLLPSKDGQPVATANSHAYRGYHETAWIINRFAHVARKHHLTDVCISSLNKIYTLPNIEIQEAFLKLREQAKCHYQNPLELAQGLEVINNTNLAYFNLIQKSEFYTLKGMFLARLGLSDEANQVFTQAVTMDMSFPKVWAEFGRFHDRVFKQDPNDLVRAANAVSCYLQAAGLYKSGKVRKLLVRILWLLSLDDASGTISKSFDSYTGELPVWYWITFAPQLITALGHREARYARIILLQIAKKYPQVGVCACKHYVKLKSFYHRASSSTCAPVERSSKVSKSRKTKPKCWQPGNPARTQPQQKPPPVRQPRRLRMQMRVNRSPMVTPASQRPAIQMEHHQRRLSPLRRQPLSMLRRSTQSSRQLSRCWLCRWSLCQTRLPLDSSRYPKRTFSD
jgi:transformation/transcription domain-associated protein